MTDSRSDETIGSSPPISVTIEWRGNEISEYRKGSQCYNRIPVKVTLMSSGWMTSLATFPMIPRVGTKTKLGQKRRHTLIFIEIQFLVP